MSIQLFLRKEVKLVCSSQKKKKKFITFLLDFWLARSKSSCCLCLVVKTAHRLIVILCVALTTKGLLISGRNITFSSVVEGQGELERQKSKLKYLRVFTGM